MNKIIECVMNVSEGRDLPLLEKLATAAGCIPGTRLLSCTSDLDHNRSVFTIIGSPENVLESSWNTCREAVRLLDIRNHQGVHPRIGVVDVVPFVPLEGASMEECTATAQRLGRRIGLELGIPVFLYGEAAVSPENVNLANIRRGALTGLAERMKKRPADYGPPEIHPSAGAMAVGSRDILIAFNMDLESRDLAAARRIAAGVRESGGGLPSVKALGLLLESRDCVQVSMNLTDYRIASVMKAFETVTRLAGAEGIQVRQSEIIGHIPRAALSEKDALTIKLKNFDPGRIYLEDLMGNTASGKI